MPVFLDRRPISSHSSRLSRKIESSSCLEKNDHSILYTLTIFLILSSPIFLSLLLLLTWFALCCCSITICILLILSSWFLHKKHLLPSSIIPELMIKKNAKKRCTKLLRVLFHTPTSTQGVEGGYRWLIIPLTDQVILMSRIFSVKETKAAQFVQLKDHGVNVSQRNIEN